MTADGEYLSGYFAWAFRDRAKRVIEDGWDRFERISRQRRWNPKPVPRNRLDSALGKVRQPGGLKLEVAVRDLPRGRDTKPGRQRWQQCAYNIGWIDFTADETSLFVTSKKEKQRLPQSLLEGFSHTLKDCVRGQCRDLDMNAPPTTAIYTECIESKANSLTMRITGRVDLRQPGKAYLCQLHGRVVYDTLRNKFTHFELVASGQRSGKCQFNFRKDDPGPAPMGVAYVLYEPAAIE